MKLENVVDVQIICGYFLYLHSNQMVFNVTRQPPTSQLVNWSHLICVLCGCFLATTTTPYLWCRYTRNERSQFLSITFAIFRFNRPGVLYVCFIGKNMCKGTNEVTRRKRLLLCIHIEYVKWTKFNLIKLYYVVWLFICILLYFLITHLVRGRILSLHTLENVRIR